MNLLNKHGVKNMHDVLIITKSGTCKYIKINACDQWEAEKIAQNKGYTLN